MEAKKRAARQLYNLMNDVEQFDREAGFEIRLLLALLNAQIGQGWTMTDTAYIAALPDGVEDERVLA